MPQVETLGSVRSELIRQLGDRDDIDTDRYNRWINDAVIAISEELETEDFASSRELITVSGQPTYALEPDVSIIRSVSIADPSDTIYGGYPLQQTDLREYRQLADIEDTPTKWMQYGNTIVLWPTPDAAYSVVIDYAVTINSLSDDIDNVPFRAGISSLVLTRARWIAFDALGQPIQAKIAEDQYTRQLQMRLDRKAQQNIGRNMQASVPRTRRQLILGERAYRSDLL